MIDGKRILGLIPARGGSKGLPRKNILPFCGKPLVLWPVEAAQKSSFVDRILVSTDDPEIAGVVASSGIEVPFLRPSQLATDTASSADVITHTLTWLEHRKELYDFIILLEPTSPFTESEDIDEALKLLSENGRCADSIVSISRVQSTHPEFDVVLGDSGLIKPYSRDHFGVPKRRQEIEPIYFLDGSLYASDVKTFKAKKTFCHDRTLGYIVPKWRAIEIDDQIDWICAEAIMAKLSEIKSGAIRLA